jgi:virginiamycin B lyase
VASEGPAGEVPTEVPAPPEPDMSTTPDGITGTAPADAATSTSTEPPSPAISTATPTPGDPCAPLRVTDFPLSAAGGRPSELALASDGGVWFTDNGSAAVGRLAPDGRVQMFPVSAGRQPVSIAIGPDGDVWFTQYAFYEAPRELAPGEFPGPPPDPPGPSAIGRISPDGMMSEYPLPTPDDPRDGVPNGRALPRSITAGPDGAMWFTESGFGQIGRIGADGIITEYPLPSTDRVHAFPDGIVLGSDGGLWFQEALAGRLGRIDPQTKNITERDYVPAGTNPMDRAVGGPLVFGPDKAFWFGDGATTITRITTDARTTKFRIAPPADGIRSMVAGPDGQIWFADQRSAALFRMTTSGVVTHLWTLPDAPRAYESVGGMAVAADGSVWVAQPWANKITHLSCPGLATGSPHDRL